MALTIKRRNNIWKVGIKYESWGFKTMKEAKECLGKLLEYKEKHDQMTKESMEE